MDSKIKRRAILVSAGMILLVLVVTFLGNTSRIESLVKRYPAGEEQEGGTPSEIDPLEKATEEESEAEDQEVMRRKALRALIRRCRQGMICGPF